MEAMKIQLMIRCTVMLLSYFVTFNTVAQAPLQNSRCKASEVMNQYYMLHPEALHEHEELEQKTQEYVQSLPNSSGKHSGSISVQKSGATYTIPVVFHVYGSTQNGATITLEKIQAALVELNKEFNGLNSDFGSVHNTFLSRRGTISIEFALAQIDPDGNPTTGVEFLPTQGGYALNGTFDAQIAAEAWDNYKYMNVYIQGDIYDNGATSESGVAFYPSVSQSNAGTARVVYNGAYIGTNTDSEFASVLTHEFGHFMNLIHPFDNGCTDPNNDYVSDTPPCDEVYDGCHPTPSANSPLNCNSELVNAENYMDYRGVSGCYKMFTQGQIARVEAALQDPSRVTLWQTSNLIETGLLNNMAAVVVISTATNPVCVGSSVTFTVDPHNEGTAPVYQWKVDGVNVGTNSPTYTASGLTTGQVVTCVMTSNMPGVTVNPATSNGITISISPLQPASVSIALTAGSNPMCSESSTTFTATPINGGTSPAYQWKVNGTNVGTNFPTYTSSSLTDGQIVTCEMISNLMCATPIPAVSPGITMSITSAQVPTVSIAVTDGSNPNCPSTAITFTATPINGGSTPSYQWKVNGANTGSDSPVFTSSTLVNGDVVTCVMNSSSLCASPTVATSNAITMVVSSFIPTGVTIALTSGTNPTCLGEPLTFNATPTNGGTSPTYYWLLNGSIVGTNSPTYTTATISNNQTVTCVITSNSSCAFPSVATSAGITMGITSIGSPNISIALTSGTNPMCVGSTATFTATPTNGGSAPSYQWKVDGVNVGTNSSVFTSGTLTNGQVVTCTMISNSTCGSPSPVTSSGITMGISAGVTPTVSITLNTGSNPMCSGETATFSAGVTNGGNTPIYQWKVNGLNVGTNSATYTTSTLTNGQVITCVLTSNASCVSLPTVTSNAITMTVNTSVSPSISIASSTGSSSVCAGYAMTFNAAIFNGGASPAYQWKVNGVNQGPNSPSFTSASLTNGQIVTCVLTSNSTCATSSTATSAGITINVITIAPPSGASNQSFCNSATVSNLNATGSSTQWYAAGTGGSTLASGTSLVNSMVYYATQNVSGCESTVRFPVTVTITNTPTPIGQTNQSFCSSATVANLTATGTSIQWFSSPSGGSPLASSTVLTNGGVYYASQTVSGCASTTRLAVTVSISSVSSPTGASTQVVCPGSTLADLVATGSQIQWYSSVSGGAPLSLTTPISNGVTYYASQSISGCESSTRLAVMVSVSTAPTTPTGDATQNICGSGTIADLVANGTSIVWYGLPTGGAVLAPTTPLSNGSNYYAAQTSSNGCESTARLAVAVTINLAPIVTISPLPTVCKGDLPVTLTQGSPVGGMYSGAGVVGSTFDASLVPFGTSTITYTYTNTNECSGTAQASILVDDCANLEALEKEGYLIYPNPATDHVTISTANDLIKAINLYDLSGQLVLAEKLLGFEHEVKIELGQLANGIYSIQIITDTKIINSKISLHK